LPSLVALQSGARRDDGRFDNENAAAQVSVGGKYALTSSLTSEATVNPDFSQVESDAAQIDVNTTFALFYPEKRPFFQEGSDLFITYFNTVYTRSINDPQFALKLTGRPGRTNVAYLFAADEHTPFIIPFEEGSAFVAAGKSYSNILRVQHALGDQSHLGMIATNRLLDGGGAGTVVGADGRVRLDQNHQIEWQALATYTDEPDDPALGDEDLADEIFGDENYTAAFDDEFYWGHALYASVERSSRHWSFDLDWWERSPTFRADNGFETHSNERIANFNTDYTIWFDDSLVEWIDPSVNVARKWNFDGVRKDEWINLNLSTRFKWAQTNLHAQYLFSNELFHDIMFDDIFAWHLCGNTTPCDLLSGGFSLNYGHRIARRDLQMGKEQGYSLWFNVKPMDRLLVENTWNYVESEAVDTGEGLFSGYIARTRLTLNFSRELSARLVVQYNKFDRIWEADPLVTYRLNPFSIFYVGSTRDYRDLDPVEYGIKGWRLTDRQYFIKLQYLFQI
jgi:hypothetical protein